MILHRFRERAEDDAELGQLAAERRRHRHRVEHRVDGDVREQLLLLERDAELVEGRADLRIDLVEAIELLLFRRRGVVAHALVVDRLVLDVLPVRLFHLEPRAERLEAPLEQPLGLALLRRDQAHHVFIEADRDDVLLGVGDEPVLVFGIRQFFDLLGRCAHKISSVPGSGLPVPVRRRSDSPHPQVLLACGFFNVKLVAIRLSSSKSRTVPSSSFRLRGSMKTLAPFDAFEHLVVVFRRGRRTRRRS